AGATAGNASRLAGRVTHGTWWNWYSRIGETPACAARVVATARAMGRGRNRSLAAKGEARATMPAVAATDSWNPSDWTRVGSQARRRSTAAPRMVAVLRGRPRRTPSSASQAITPARITD